MKFGVGSHLYIIRMSWGFWQSNQDSRLYLFKEGGNFIKVILVVDDMAFSSNSRSLINWFKDEISTTFKVKLLGNFKLFIVWEISRSTHGLYIGRELYVQRLLANHNFGHVKSSSTPLPLKCDLTIKRDNEAA